MPQRSFVAVIQTTTTMNATMRNKVQLFGYLGNDPEIKDVGNGRQMARLQVATKDRYKSGDEWKEDTQWHLVVAWGRQAEQVAQLLHKGSKIAVEGRLVHRDYLDKEGQKRYVTEVVMSDFQLMSMRKEAIGSVAAEAE